MHIQIHPQGYIKIHENGIKWLLLVQAFLKFIHSFFIKCMSLYFFENPCVMSQNKKQPEEIFFYIFEIVSIENCQKIFLGCCI